MVLLKSRDETAKPVVELENAAPTPTSIRLPKILKIARRAALKAGHLLQKGREHDIQVIREKALRDELLDSDLVAERAIIDYLHKKFPLHDILSEESSEYRQPSPCQWVIDPLDGSFNFLHKNPTFGVAICFCIEQKPMVGVIYLPFYKEMFTAIKGQGACLNGRAIHVSQTSDLNHAIIHAGDFAKDGNLEENKEQIITLARLANSVGRIRMIGTAAADLAYVACGRADALIMRNAPLWDIQAGELLLTEAGGMISPLRDSVGERLLICSNKAIYKPLLDEFRLSFDTEYGWIQEGVTIPVEQRSLRGRMLSSTMDVVE